MVSRSIGSILCRVGALSSMLVSSQLRTGARREYASNLRELPRFHRAGADTGMRRNQPEDERGCQSFQTSITASSGGCPLNRWHEMAWRRLVPGILPYRHPNRLF
jgi:hypothetical protein